MNINQLSESFKTFAKRECEGSSDLYEFLSLKIAEDDWLLELSSYAREGQPIPNLLLGAVHYLLLKGKNHVLREYYPSIVEHSKVVKESYIHFQSFCELYREEIISILQEKLVQTNEVRRCAYLYPTFSYIYNKTNRPLALIEIGTSAGLQLLWDKYSYSYLSNEVYGDHNSELRIIAEIRGEKTPKLLSKSPPVNHRFGLDLHINDVTNEEDSLWLNSLIWPEHYERRELFKQAIECIHNNRNEINLIEGDGVELLPHIVDQIPPEAVIGVFHTHVANQMPENTKYKLLEYVKEIGEKRDVFHLYNNMWDRDLHLDYFINQIEHNEIIGETDGHGRWFSWKL
ncbi:DUF2332 domain-containing protein [Neobacillus sp. PS3-34]|nr:DUF2332 domain-containing protein [Neobacillus sp. PS3-34]WML48297.1 DUF2332 domain-containing protein [Neobacillus sp. PS3-34]